MSFRLSTRAPPLGMISLALIVLLATLAIGYGLWSKNLVVNGRVHTGDLRVDWDFIPPCSEFHPWPTGGNPGEYLGKDVGSTTAQVDPDDHQILHLTVTNGYPSYSFDCQVEWKNTGTIPVNMAGFALVPGPGLTGCTVTGNNTKTMACDQLTIVFVDGTGMQIDPGEATAESLRGHIEQAAAQDATYGFQVKICVAQWNELATYDECVTSPQHEGPP